MVLFVGCWVGCKGLLGVGVRCRSYFEVSGRGGCGSRCVDSWIAFFEG